MSRVWSSEENIAVRRQKEHLRNYEHCSELIELKTWSGLPWGSDSKESTCNVGDLGSIPGSGISPGEGNGYPLQYSCLGNPIEREAWRTTVNRVAKSLVKAMVFPVVMYGLESWTIKKLSTKELMVLNCGVGEDSWESLDCKEIQPVHPKRRSVWLFIGRTDIEAETPILRPPDGMSLLIWKDCDAGKDWGQEEKGMTGDEMVGWHHRLNGHGFGWTPGVGDGQGGLACCGSWGCQESDTTERLNWTKLKESDTIG